MRLNEINIEVLKIFPKSYKLLGFGYAQRTVLQILKCIVIPSVESENSFTNTKTHNSTV